MKPRTYKFNTLLEIEWLDIISHSEWLTPHIAMHAKACSCKTAGFFLNQDEDVIRISPTIQTKDMDRDVTIIPWGCVISIKKG